MQWVLSMYVEEFRASEPYVVVRQLVEEISFYGDQSLLDSFGQEVRARLEYLLWIFDYSDASLFSREDMSFLEGQINTVRQHFEFQGGSFLYESQISNSLTQIFARFPYARIKKFVRNEINEKIIEFTTQVGQLQSQIAHLEARLWDKNSPEVDRLQKVVSKIGADLEASEIRIREKVQSVESRLDDSSKNRLDSISIQNEKKISQILEDYRSEVSKIEASLNKYEVQYQNLENTLTGELKKVARTVKDDLSAEKQRAGELVERIRALYSVAGQTALAGGFTEAAEKEDEVFRANSIWAKWILGGTAIFLAGIWVYSIFFIADYDPLSLLLKLPATLILLLPGAYFASIASKARIQSTKLRSLGLRIAAFEAYVDNFKQEGSPNLKHEMAKHFFEGVDEADADKSRLSGRLNGDVVKLLEKMVDKMPTIGG